MKLYLTDSGCSKKHNVTPKVFCRVVVSIHRPGATKWRLGQNDLNNQQIKKEIKMKKFAAVLFVFLAVFSNVSFATDKECHPEKEHCEKH